MASSPGPSPSPSPSPASSAAAGLQIEPSGPILALWVTAFVFANVYAWFWLAKAVLHAYKHYFTAFRLKLFTARMDTSASVEPSITAQGRGVALQKLDLHSSVSDQRRDAVFPVMLEWRDLGYSVLGAGSAKVILEGITGAVAPGELQALIGPSGAGKSTLMDKLSMREASGGTSGSGAKRTGVILVNGVKRDQGFLKVSSYVPQHDNLVPTMTCDEALQFYACVILGSEVTRVEREQRIRDTLRLVGLQERQHALVGGTLPGGLMLRGLSGGEKKRLCIAAGVLARPSVVFLDEPTTGLDSQAALQVLDFMKAAARQGHTLMASVHQPRLAIWNLFDSVTLLSKGRLMYHGPTSAMVPWFNVLGYPYDPATHGAPSDWVLDLVSLGFDKTSDDAESAGLMDAASQELFEDAVSEVEGGSEFAAASPRASGGQNAGKAVVTAASNGDGVVGRVSSGGSGVASPKGGAAAVAGGSSGEGGVVNRRLSIEEVQAVVASKVTHDAMAYTMSSQEELESAAAAFRFCQKQLKPEWFEARGMGGRSGRSSNGNLVGMGGASEDYLKPEEAVAYEGYMGKFAGMGHVLQVPASAALARQLLRSQAGDKSSGAVVAAAAGSVGAGGVALAVRAGGPPTTAAAAAEAATANGGTVSASRSSSGEETCYADAMSAITGVGPQSPRTLESVFEPIRASSPGEQRAEVQMLGSGLGLKKKRGFWAKVQQGWVQFKALMWRDYLMMIRNPADVAGRMLTFSYVAAFSGLIAYGVPGGASSLLGRLFVIYGILSFYLMMPFVFMALYWNDKRFYASDAASKMYPLRAYYPAKIIASLPFNLAVGAVFHLIYYGMAGMRHGPLPILMSLAIASLVALIGGQVMYTSAVLMPTQDLAFVIAIGWTAINLLVCPVMMMYNNYKLQWFSYIRYFSMMSFAWEGMARVELLDRGFPCDDGKGGRTPGLEVFGIYRDFIPKTGGLATFSAAMNNPNSLGPNCIASGNVVLEYYGATRSFGATMGILLGYLGVLHIISYAALWITSRKLAGKK